MNLFNKTDATTSILAYDIFLLLGISNISDEQKEKYLSTLEKVILQYFLQEKIGDALSKEQLEELMRKYPPEDEKNVEAMMEAIGAMLPDASDLMVDAMIEVKARAIRDQYETSIKMYEKLLSEAKSQNIRDELQNKIEESKKRLELANGNKWSELATAAEKTSNMSHE